MKNKLSLVALIFAGLLLAAPVSAEMISFGDHSIYWPGYPATDDLYGPDNTREEIGGPHLAGGRVVFGPGGITSIGIMGNGYSGVLPGDLFIDFGANQTWDYVVAPKEGSYYVFPVSIALNNSSAYLMTGKDNQAPWAGYDVRNQHPYALANPPDPSSAWGTASFSGLVENGYSTFSFDKPIPITGDFIVGWTVNCANDVIYETVPAPEPAGLLLLGFGLIGLLAFRKQARD